MLANGRLDRNASELDFQRYLREFAVVVPHFYVMQTPDAGFFHFVRDRMTAIAREPISRSTQVRTRK
ncbi:hypothetical protein V1282_006528 [Nitrobacteraceae bacterium AZCC 2146]